MCGCRIRETPMGDHIEVTTISLKFTFQRYQENQTQNIQSYIIAQETKCEAIKFTIKSR